MTFFGNNKMNVGGNDPFDPKNSSVPLPNGGDTHIHPHRDQNGFTITTRLPGDIVIHDTFNIKR